VVTLWYRAPELLMGVASYTTAIDIWSIGCLIAELFLLRTLLQGRDELEQLNLIFNLCGTPTPETWPALRQEQAPAAPPPPFPSHPPNPSYRPRIVKQQLSCTPGGKEGADLVDKLLALNPSSRWSAEQALDHDYLWMEDPKEPGELPPIMHLRRAQTSAGGKG
jgi:serine/threonine protein kinase